MTKENLMIVFAYAYTLLDEGLSQVEFIDKLYQYAKDKGFLECQDYIIKSIS